MGGGLCRSLGEQINCHREHEAIVVVSMFANQVDAPGSSKLVNHQTLFCLASGIAKQQSTGDENNAPGEVQVGAIDLIPDRIGSQLCSHDQKDANGDHETADDESEIHCDYQKMRFKSETATRINAPSAAGF